MLYKIIPSSSPQFLLQNCHRQIIIHYYIVKKSNAYYLFSKIIPSPTCSIPNRYSIRNIPSHREKKVKRRH